MLQLSVLGLPGKEGQELSLIAQISPYTTEATAARIRDAIYQINQTFPAATAVKKFYFTFDELAPPTAVKVSRPQLTKKIADGQVTLTPFSQFRQDSLTLTLLWVRTQAGTRQILT